MIDKNRGPAANAVGPFFCALRRGLDLLYLGSGALAAFFLVAIFAIVLLQVGANMIDDIVKLIIGEPIGLVIPSYADFTGFFLAAASFLALAHTLRRGAHIRVNLVIQHITGRPRRWLELWCVAAAALLAGYMAVYLINLVLESFEFGDVSYGIIPVPLWIPQSSLALGAIIVTIALVDEFVNIWRGAEPNYEKYAETLETIEESPGSTSLDKRGA